MARKHNTTKTPANPYAGLDMGDYGIGTGNLDWIAAQPIEAIVAIGEEEPERKSGGIVKGKYKARYAARGNPRGCNDWLQNTLAPLTLNEFGKLRVAEFEAILDANGVKHAHWNRTTNGWQGRLRMSGGIALRTKVAEQYGLMLPDGELIEAPVEFCDKHMH
jgi:hypothetical protein